MMLEGGQQPKNRARLTFLKWDNQAERQLYLGGIILTFLVMVVALVIGLLADSDKTRGQTLLQFGVATLVFCFSIFGDMVGGQDRATTRNWEIGAGLGALAVIITSSFTGGFFNILLVPLLLGLMQRRGNTRLLIGLGLGALIVVVIQTAVFAILGLDRSTMNGAVTTLTAIAAITFSLSNLMRRYQSQVKLYQEEAANKASEMEVAHEIQTSLMPPNMFTSGSWTLAARSLPAKDVGGDFYEYVSHPHMDQTISGIAIGDVAGKGIPAALQMAVVRTLFRVEARRRIFPGETLMSVNSALQAERSFGMVTMLYAFLDLNSNTLHLANAGHNYPLLLNGTLEEIKLPGLPLGIDDEIEYDEKIIQITPGTSVIFYTDGVVEAMDTEDNLFTFERLKDAVQANQKLGPEDMVEKILEEISIFTEGAPQSDDITVLVLQYHPKPDEVICKPVELEPVGVQAENGYSNSLEVEVDENGANWI